ncbi:MAG TPA: mechanosensitive ion channel family protein [Xanthobacteraceae bacterium]|nr:mechanosensitive ion channel family protein [Xanthobacteraceae bacterium]
MQLDSLRALKLWVGTILDLAPPLTLNLAALALAVVIGLLAHSIVIGVLNRLIGDRRAFLSLLLTRTAGPTRLAAVIAAVSVVTAWAPVDPAVSQAITHALIIAFIILVGWMAIIAVALAADIYLRRFTLDAEDNLLARKHVTQVRILQRAADTLTIVITVAAAFMTFETVRQYGVSLFASAGVVGIVVGLAARPVLSNFIAGIQIAMTQPIRLEDAVIVESEFGWVEDIAAAYVVIRLWDRRRMIVPLSYFIEKPFQNWSRQATNLIGSVVFYVDYTAPVGRIRDKLNEIVAQSPLWDQQVVSLQVNEIRETTMQLRALVSAKTPDMLSNLQAELREKLVDFLQKEHPEALPRGRALELTPRASDRPQPSGAQASAA